MYLIYCILSFFLFPFGVFAASVDVTADMPSGTYHTPINITLTPTEIGAKTFYSFKPDGYPNDAFLYTGAILLKHSSPFIYFSFLSTSNESKIKQNNYIIEYPSTIHFESESISGSGQMKIIIVNSSSESVNIGYWYVQSESDTAIIPEGTIITSGEKYIMHLNYTGTSAVALRSPDEDEKDILVPKTPPVPNETILPKKKPIVTKTVPRKIISIEENTPTPIKTQPENTDASVTKPTVGVNIPEANTIKIESPPIINQIPPSDFNQMIKVSTNESGQKNMNPVYLIVLLILSGGVGGIQWFMRRKQK